MFEFAEEEPGPLSRVELPEGERPGPLLEDVPIVVRTVDNAAAFDIEELVYKVASVLGLLDVAAFVFAG